MQHIRAATRLGEGAKTRSQPWKKTRRVAFFASWCARAGGRSALEPSKEGMMNKSLPYRRTALALLAAIGVLVVVTPGGATPPGKNGLISFRRYFNDEHTTGALFNIRPDGTGETQITFPGSDELDTNQNWSPDGSQIVYEHITPTTDQIYIVGWDGSNPHLVFPCPGNDACAAAGDPSWSPDGQWIAFELVQGPFPNDTATDVSIWEVHPDGTGLHQVTHPIGFQQSEDNHPQWSPDGKRLVLQRNFASRRWAPEIWTVNSSDGGQPQRVSPPGVNGSDHPDWSPDGQWIIFRTENDAPGSVKVYLAHPDGTAVHPILDVPAKKGAFFSYSFSPDGTQITIGAQPGCGTEGRADVYTGRLDSHARLLGLTSLTCTDDWESSPRWGTHPFGP
jgi:TolB protein